MIIGASERRFSFLYVFIAASGLVTSAHLALVTNHILQTLILWAEVQSDQRHTFLLS
jgi:hypothetical protein